MVGNSSSLHVPARSPYPSPSPAGCPARSDADLTLTSSGRGSRGGCELEAPGRAMGQGELGRGRGWPGVSRLPPRARSGRPSQPCGGGAELQAECAEPGRAGSPKAGSGLGKRGALWSAAPREKFAGFSVSAPRAAGAQALRAWRPSRARSAPPPPPSQSGPRRAAPSPPTGCGLRPGRGRGAVVAAPSGRDRPAGGSAPGRRGRPGLPWVEAGSRPARSRPDPPASPTPAVTRRLRARARAAASSAMDRSVPDPVPRSAPRTPAAQPAGSAG